ncbi:MAG: SDR family oxidoreductase [bacterium]|nr:SDR family oxidoreductase [bacterium]
MGSLQGKRAFVTGAGQGIGHAIAKELIEAGCDVCLHYHSSAEGARELIKSASSSNQRAACYQADLTSEEEAVACVKQVTDFLGGMDVLINNVGDLVARHVVEDIDLAFWQKSIDINLTSMMVVTRESVPYLAKEEDASIVNLASLAGRKGGHAGSLVYSMTKGAVLTWTRGLSTELAPKGIRVNSVAPGLILGSRFHATHTTKESAQATIQGIPLGRAGTVEDVARAVAFLASEYDGFITGATLDINGGVYCA